MKLANLKALAAAIEYGSLRGAARYLKLSQPALTKALRDLELELGAPLLIRSSVGVLPTAQGKVLHSHTLKVLRELNAATDQIKQLSGNNSGELSVAAVPLAVMLLIPETLRTFSREFPQIRLTVSEELYMAQLPRLRAGAIDIAIGGVPVDLANGEFTIEHLMDTQMVPVVNRSSQRVRAKSLIELLDARWIYTSTTSVEGYAKQLFETHGLPQPAIGAVVNSTLALLSLITSGDFVGLMPIQIAQHPWAAAHLKIIPIREEGLPLKVGAMIRKDISVTPSIRHFLAHLHRAAN